ncbi:MAG: carboxypeptidase M32 [Halobacteriota archaeon]
MAESASDTTASAPEAYEQLIERYRRISNLSFGSSYLSWDQQVMMPEGGAPGRSQQLSALAATRHELLIDDAVGEWLEDLDEDDLSDAQRANVREIRRAYERAANVPSSVVEAISQTSAENQQIWQQAKAEDDFETFAPRLVKLRELTVERASHIDPKKEPYVVMYEDGHPYIPIETMEGIFDTLKTELPPLIDEIRTTDAALAHPFEGEYPEEEQRALSEAALDFVGYDRSRGRLDTAPHPFMTGNQFDARVTTRFKPTDPMDALTATIHEFGHASYQLGLPQEHYGTPLGESQGSIHESQSRFWENHVGRTRPFWEAFLPTVKEHLHGTDDLTVEAGYEAANRVRPNNLIRVEADELTYHLHIVLRCEIDRAFVAGDLEVDEIPSVWNDNMESYLGVRPETDTEGCLQDIHWTNRFAGFHSYTLGTMVAAQLDRAIRDDLDVDALVREGEFDPIHEWMTDHLHRHGKRYETPELIERATGEPLSAEPFVEYVTEKFGRLYDL